MPILDKTTESALPGIGRDILYVPAEEEPLSSDAFLIRGRHYTYVYDVGSSQAARHQLQREEKPLVIMLSHLHADHTANLACLTYAKLYVGGKTRQKLRVGETLTEDMLCFHDGPELELRRCPSVHENGSLILTVNREYTLLGDLVYPLHKPDLSLALDMLKQLTALDTRYFVVSHRKGKVFEKAVFLRMVKQLLAIP